MSKSPEEIIISEEWWKQESPAARRNAEGVAKRLRTEIEKKFPLFANQITTLTADEVLERRRALRASILEDWAEMERREHEAIGRYKQEIRTLVSEDEFDDLCAREEGSFARGFNYWYGVREKIKRRKDPMLEDTARILEFLRAWPDPITHHELFEAMKATGDFSGKKEELLAALHWLNGREYIRICQGRRCEATGCIAATWKAKQHAAA
ncbi:MAG: hypothetical protein AB1631_30645 [Acidobacteriota bacterium]